MGIVAACCLGTGVAALVRLGTLFKPRVRPVPRVPVLGLRVFPDCSLLFPMSLLVLTAIGLRPAFHYLYEGAWLLFLARSVPYPDFTHLAVALALFVAYLKSRIRDYFTTSLCDGTYVYIQTPWIIRTLFPRRSRGRVIEDEALKLIQWFRTYLYKLQRLYDFLHSSTFIDKVHTGIPHILGNFSGYRLRRASRALLIFALSVSTYERQDHTAIYKSDDNPGSPRTVHFDNDFDVLFDNGANCSIGISEDDFISIDKRTSTLSGVGSVTAYGIGTIHWKARLDNGKMLDIFIDNALYVPDMHLRIISVAQWGRQRTRDRQDGNKDFTHMLTFPDSDRSVIHVNQNRDTITIPHTNDLARYRCEYPNQRAVVAHYHNNRDHTTYHQLYQKWHQAYNARRTHDPTQPLLRIQDQVDPENIPFERTSIQPRWNDSLKHLKKSTAKKVHFPDVPERVLTEKALPPSHATTSPDKSILRPSSYKPREPFHKFRKPSAPKSESKPSKPRPIPTLQVPSTLPSNFTPKQELLAWHLKLGHLPFSVLIQAAKLGILPKRIAECKDHPKCPSCLYGAGHRRPWRRSKSFSPIQTASKPGDCVSIDQLQSSVPGVIAQNETTQRFRLTQQRFKYATVFVDHFSRLSYVHIHQTTDADDAIAAKNAFEEYAAQRNVFIQHYHCDNGIFRSDAFIKATQAKKQSISFCGADAHHQSGIAEHRIRTLSDSARTQLLHALTHNSRAVAPQLWPYALKHANYLFNALPRSGNSQSPEQLFSSTTADPNIGEIHPFGCPVYVLESALASGKSLPRWNPRTRLGLYLGPSPHHASTVGLILNLRTGFISPQFHCTYDDYFETPKLDGNIEAHWKVLTHLDDDPDPDFHLDPFSSSSSTPSYRPSPSLFPDFDDSSESEGEIATSSQDSQNKLPIEEDDDDDVDVTDVIPTQITPPPPSTRERHTSKVTDVQTRDEALQEQELDLSNFRYDPHETAVPEGATNQDLGWNDPDATLFDDPNSDTIIIDTTPPTAEATPSPVHTRPQRIRQKPTFFSPSMKGQYHQGAQSYLIELFDPIRAFIEDIAYAMSMADQDTMTLKQALQEPDADCFLKAMSKEVKDHEDRDHWFVVTVHQMIRSGYKTKPIMAVWSMKRKRNPLGQIVKYKARLCAHGGQTVQGIHYKNTYAPVVTWTTIRFLLTLSVINNWHTRQIDFVLAYPQAKISHDVYMLPPEKFTYSKSRLILDQEAPSPWKSRYRLKLLQNLYGLKDAGNTWYNHLRKGLTTKMGFRQSLVDPCLFYRDHVMLAIYVDDCIIFTPEKKYADQLYKELASAFAVEDEGDVNHYLGINITRPDKDTISMTQPALIQRIIDSLPLKDARLHDTPADPNITLTPDKNGQPRQDTFHYRSLVGQLNYLTASTRPEIQYAVHQLARFSANPKRSHEVAAKRVIRYLKSTPEKGILLRPDRKQGLTCYVDADFAGNWSSDQALDPRACLSRTGYVIFYANCPITWHSKLQSTIALSTTEAEYVALSTAMRDVIYFMNLIDEMKASKIQLPETPKPCTTCRVFEDNVGALELANTHKLRPRTKHLAVQLHHFRQYILNGKITVEKIATKFQRADIFTKALPRDAFRQLRSTIIGW